MVCDNPGGDQAGNSQIELWLVLRHLFARVVWQRWLAGQQTLEVEQLDGGILVALMLDLLLARLRSEVEAQEEARNHRFRNVPEEKLPRDPEGGPDAAHRPDNSGRPGWH